MFQSCHRYLPQLLHPLQMSLLPQVTLKKMLSQPLPQSGGRHSRTRWGRLVSRKNTTSLHLTQPCHGFQISCRMTTSH